MEKPTVMPIMALAAIITAGISWIFDVARTVKANIVTATETNSVIFLPYFWRTNPASRAEKIAPKGTALAAKKIVASLREDYLLLNGPTLASFYFLSFQTHYRFYNKYVCEKMSIQYTVPGFELTTWTRLSCCLTTNLKLVILGLKVPAQWLRDATVDQDVVSSNPRI